MSKAKAIPRTRKRELGPMTPFFEAKSIMKHSGQEELAKLKNLLLRNPDLTREHGEDGQALLHVAIEGGGYLFVPLLLEFGANPNTLTPDGRSPLGLCYLTDEPRINECRRLLEGAGARRTSKETLGEFLLSGRVAEVLAFWKEHPEWIDCFPYPHGHCLHLSAIGSPNSVLVEHLLQHGVGPNVTGQYHETPLHRVSDRVWRDPDVGTEEIIDALLRYGADINQVDKSGDTPLHCYARRPWASRLVYLVGRGAELNRRNLKGETPLDIIHSRRFPNYRKVIVWLKSQGAKR